jgi:hypothetical protein
LVISPEKGEGPIGKNQDCHTKTSTIGIIPYFFPVAEKPDERVKNRAQFRRSQIILSLLTRSITEHTEKVQWA